jgi:hypothetical protein
VARDEDISQGRIEAVEESIAGSELSQDENSGVTLLHVLDTADFAEDGGTLIIRSQDGTTTETVDYTEVDDDELTITLATATTTAFLEGDRVELVPEVIERTALVLLDDDDDDEVIYARVPISLYDRVPTGIRAEGDQESFLVEWDGEEYVLYDQLGERPVISGTFIDTEGTTIVVTDGNPPSSSPTPTVQGGVGFLAVTWDAITNADPVRYEVHIISETDRAGDPDWTPSASTLAGEVNGTVFFIREMPNGDALIYTNDDGETAYQYYVKLIAHDPDGAAGPSSEGVGHMMQVTSSDIAVRNIFAEHIFVAEITANELSSVINITNTLIAGQPGGSEVIIDGDGLRLHAPSGELLVKIPTDPNDTPVFNGKLIAEELTVNGATLLGDTTVGVGASIQLNAGVLAPNAAPLLNLEYETVTPYEQKSWFCLSYLAAGGPGLNTPMFYTSRPGSAGYWRAIEEINAATGAHSRTFLLPNSADDDTWGVVALGTNLFVLHQRWSTGQYYIRKYSIATLTETASIDVTSAVTSKKPGLGTDGTDIFLICGANQASPANLRMVRYNTSLTQLSNATHNALTVDTRETGGGKTTEFGGMVKVGSTYYLAVYSYNEANITRRKVFAFTGNPNTNNGLSRNADEDFVGADGAEADGITHDGSHFWTVLDGGYFTKHTNWTWTSSDSDKYHIGYTWRDDQGNGEGIQNDSTNFPPGSNTKHETDVSPRGVITMRKRAALRVTTGLQPGAGGVNDPNRRNIYVGRGSTEPTAGGRFDGNFQASLTSATGLIEDFVAPLTGTPTVRAVGTVAAGTGTVTPGSPSGSVAGDLWLMFVENSGEGPATAAGWTQLLTISGTGVALTVLWRIVVDPNTDNRTVDDVGDHQLARIIGVTQGTFNPLQPFSRPTQLSKQGSTTSVVIPGGTTERANALIFAVSASDLPDADGTTQFSGVANPDLGSVTEHIDNTTSAGNGGALFVATGTKATAGAFGNTTVTAANAGIRLNACFAIMGAAQNPSTNNFEDTGTPAALKSQRFGLEFRADGTFIMPTMTSTQRPASPVQAQMYFDSDAQVVWMFNGRFWEPMTPIALNRALWYYDDFATPATASAFGVTQATGGTGSVSSASSAENQHPGHWDLNVSAVNDRAGIISNAASYPIGAGLLRVGFLIKSPAAASDSANRYTLYAGLMDALAESSVNNGCYFRYRDTLTSGTNWQRRNVNGGVQSVATLNVSPETSKWHLLEIEINADGTEAKYFINGALKSTATAQMPTTQLRLVCGIEKNAGSTSRTMKVDAYYALAEPSAARYAD